MAILEQLRKLNPELPFYSVLDPEFRAYGRVIDFDAASLIETCEKAAVMPESGSRYLPDMPELEALPVFADVKHTLRGEGGCQIGCCWGYNTRLNCLEYHRASEHNVAVSDLVLLLGRQQDMEGFDLPAGKIKAFFVPREPPSRCTLPLCISAPAKSPTRASAVSSSCPGAPIIP